MGGTHPERWRMLRPLLDEALDLEGEARDGYLANLKAKDAALAAELAALLAEHERMVSRPDHAAIDLAAIGLSEHFAGEDERAHDEARVGQWVGPYRLQRLLGTGGMGAVYLAEHMQGGFAHTVALKAVRRTFGSVQIYERFERERQILAALRHSGIALLFDGGRTPDGQPYYTMEYVDGRPITEYCEANIPDVAGRVRLLKQLGATLAYAHRNLIVHRDIKSSNVLVTPEGQVKVVDFGLAKLLDEHILPSVTQYGIGPMTPAYAAPEQFLGGATTVATDVYQFGVLCFLVLAGALPYRADPNESLEWARAVTEAEPVKLAQATHHAHAYARQLTRDLDAIVRKALAKAPDDRYRSMDAMVADLDAFLDGRPVSARRAGAAYYTWRFVVRRRFAVAAGVLAFVALGAAALVARHQSHVALEEASRANREADRASAVATFLIDLFKVSDPGLNRGEHLNANELLERGSKNIETHFASQPEERARFLAVIGEVYLSLGELERARTTLGRSVDIYGASPSPDPYAFSKALRLLARATNSAGDPAAAGRLVDQAESLVLDESEKSFEERARLQVVRTGVQTNLGNLAGELDELTRGIAYAKRAGEPSRSLLVNMELTMGTVLRDLGRYPEALATLKAAYAQTLGNPDDENQRALAARSLGEAFMRNDELADAERLLEPLDAATLKQFGALSLEYGELMETLGDLAHRQGRNSLALERLHLAEQALGAVFGESHPARAWVIVSSGEIMIEEGRYDDALARMQEALALRRRVLADDHAEVAHSYYALAEALVALHRYPEARDYVGKALPAMRKSLPPDHPMIVLCLTEAGLVEFALGKRTDAQKYWDEALDRASRAYPPQARDLAKIQRTISDPDAALRRSASYGSKSSAKMLSGGGPSGLRTQS